MHAKLFVLCGERLQGQTVWVFTYSTLLSTPADALKKVALKEGERGDFS